VTAVHTAYPLAGLTGCDRAWEPHHGR